jgi:transposase-like protein
MTRSKLSDLEKQEIVSLFEGQQETIASLALRYEVSSSTIRRLLKQPGIQSVERVEAAEEEVAVEPSPAKKTLKPISKRTQTIAVKQSEQDLNQTFEGETLPSSRSIPAPPVVLSPKIKKIDLDQDRGQRPISRTRDSLDSGGMDYLNQELASANRLSSETDPSTALDELPLSDKNLSMLSPHQDDMSEIIREISYELDGSFPPRIVEEDVEDDDDDDFEDDDDDLAVFDHSDKVLHLKPEGILEVMPLSEAILPKTCYLVIDRTSELVTRPLKDFGELGQIPVHEIQSRTLPLFDNHRIARRFSHRTQRIIKVPNSSMIRAACAQLSAKGITRLLVNGRIYALQ